jgi:ABC-type multidrug transport system permease subunit
MIVRRFWQLLINEFRLARTVIPVHLIAVFQPTLIYVLMTYVLVTPTFDVAIRAPTTPPGERLLDAMTAVRTTAGVAYINPIVVEDDALTTGSQLISVQEVDGRPTAVQSFNLIDSNIVKNYRNRLTAAALLMWNADLGERALTIDERPWLPVDVPYDVFFGMAMLPMTTILTTVLVGAYTIAREFERDTIREYRLSPIHPALILTARIIRLVLTGWLAAGILIVAIGWLTGWWPDSIVATGAILLPIALIGSCLGISAGLITKSSLPSFLTGLVSTFGLWLLGGAFGLTAGFSGPYEAVSRVIPNTHAVELLFPHYYGRPAGYAAISIAVLAAYSVVMLALVARVYYAHVVLKEK